MPSKLIIVESPTKAKTISRFLGSDYDVEATMGHIMDLPKSTLAVDVEKNFEPEYVEVPKRKETIDTLKKIAKKAKEIYLASDPDREGEAIAYHVKQILGKAGSKIYRISFHEITKEALEEALKSPRAIDTNLVDAQTARRVLDRLVGYKLSPLLWKKVRVGLSAGRVQTVSVRLIVEKEREIAKFKPEEYWEIYADVKNSKSKEFRVTLVKHEVNSKVLSDKVLSELKGSSYKVSDVRRREVTKNPYPPFTTSTMTQAGSRLFGWSSKKTMSLAQKLYEEGLITYHRTDSLNLSKSAVDKVRSFISKEFGGNYLPDVPRFYKTTSKVAQEAHEAIRPTNASTQKITVNKFQEEAQKLYNLIWARFVASQMGGSIYDETVIDVAAGKYNLRASGQIMKFDGWRRVLPSKKDTEEVLVALPEVAKGEELKLIKVEGIQKFTQPPARFNEASLIKTLEKLGIGRPSTYAPTISTILARNYVEKNDSKAFVPTPVGIAVNDFLISNFSGIFEYEFTAGMEDSLDKIADGKLLWQKPIKDFYNPLAKKLKDVEKNSERVKIEVEKLNKPCPTCKEGELVVRTGRFGKFISCSRFPECKHTEKYILKVGVKCPDCKKGDVIIKKTSKGRKFFGCSRYPDCKYASWKNPKKENQTPEEK